MKLLDVLTMRCYNLEAAERRAFNYPCVVCTLLLRTGLRTICAYQLFTDRFPYLVGKSPGPIAGLGLLADSAFTYVVRSRNSAYR